MSSTELLERLRMVLAANGASHTAISVAVAALQAEIDLADELQATVRCIQEGIVRPDSGPVNAVLARYREARA